MAFSNLEKAMATFIGLDIVRPGTSRTAAKAAVGTLIRAAQIGAPVAARGIAAGVPAIGSAAAAAPVTTGTLLGLGALATPPGQTLLEASAESGRQARRDLELALQFAESSVRSPSMRARAKKKVSSYNRAVKVGMSALKGSKFMGKKGTLSNAKKAFATVNKTVSALKKGKKVRRTGATGTIARATSKLPGISSIKVRK
jgi:hypothetical protein